jgi:hypothetical protein
MIVNVSVALDPPMVEIVTGRALATAPKSTTNTAVALVPSGETATEVGRILVPIPVMMLNPSASKWEPNSVTGTDRPR